MGDKITTARDVLIAILALALVLFLNGAVPFFATPTLAPALWTTGFSLSFLNESIFSIYAKNFGAPMPAAMVFGLSGGWPTAFLIKMGLHPADAYSAMVAFWLAVAFFFAYRIAQFFGMRRWLAILAAAVWATMPIIWKHEFYGTLALGIGLLPFYFWAALKLFLTDSFTFSRKWFLYIGIYFVAALIAVFMDGYSFMMFAVMAGLLCCIA